VRDHEAWRPLRRDRLKKGTEMENHRNRTAEEEAAWRCTEPPNPQEGMDTFSRNHPATWDRHDPRNTRVEQRAASLRLRQRAPQIEAGDKLTAAIMIEAAVLLEQATFAESIWEERARKAEHRLMEVAHGR